jgi:hypothetical protein
MSTAQAGGSRHPRTQWTKPQTTTARTTGTITHFCATESDSSPTIPAAAEPGTTTDPKNSAIRLIIRAPQPKQPSGGTADRARSSSPVTHRSSATLVIIAGHVASCSWAIP